MEIAQRERTPNVTPKASHQIHREEAKKKMKGAATFKTDPQTTSKWQ